MLMLRFYIGDVAYLVKADKVREVAPMVALKQVPHSPNFFAGYFNYRGTVVPVIDLSQLILGQDSDLKLSSRIILVDYTQENGDSYILGIIVERLLEAVKIPVHAFKPPKIRSSKAPYLAGIVMEKNQMIQYLDLDYLPDCIDLLPESGMKHRDGASDN